MTTTPIIPWMGGKRRLADKLLPYFPEHECYVEVFSGGAALFFMRDQPARVEILNDINGELVNLYRVVQHHLEEFVRQFKWALSSRQVFAWLQETKPPTLTDIQRAARFFYLQHHAFSGKVAGRTFGTATTASPINLLRIDETLAWPWPRSCGRARANVMVSINDQPDTRAAFYGMHMKPLRIRYSMANKQGTPAESSELMITNYEPVVSGGLF